MSLSIYIKGDYEEFHASKAAKNKANSKPTQSQIPGFGRTCKRLTKRISDMIKADLAETEMRDNKSKVTK